MVEAQLHTRKAAVKKGYGNFTQRASKKEVRQNEEHDIHIPSVSVAPIAQMGGWALSRITHGKFQNLFSIGLPNLILFFKARFFLDLRFNLQQY